ncbi:dienelactone hydrolase family protein [Altererythrobacter sp.]|uniref:dienelactone hydrolase family protein n=1 Tax=Altererythrobacter sp. TaxID=1872480 RepID=UPI003D016D4D
MCDEANLKQWARERISRRQFGVLAGAATIAACGSSGQSNAEDGLIELTESGVTFETADGTMDGFFVRPASGLAPGVIMWPDIAGLREAKRSMARRLAGEGYAVFVANPYYRDVAGEQFADFAAFIDEGGFQKVGPWREKFTAETVTRDARSVVAWIDAQDGVDTARGIGTQGYCMTGSFALWTAAAVPERVKAAASFHGGGLVRADDPLSPHAVMGKMQAELLIAIAQNDDAKAPDDKTALREAADAAGRTADIKVYGGDHGWTVLDSPSYAEGPAEEAWAALLALYKRTL